MSHFSKLKVAGWVVTSFLTFACGGKPLISVIDDTGKPGPSTIVAQGGAGFQVTDAGNPNNTQCKTTCDTGECGPIADGCGSFVQCGGCTAPAICGGAGVPSHCGQPVNNCVPKTCADLGKTCGQQSDGCGGIVDCWPDAADASATPACPVAGQQCVNGTCQSTTPTCVPLTCDHYANTPDLCGPVSDGCGSTIDCSFTCSPDKVCGLLTPGKCDQVVCTPQTCDSALQGTPQGFCGAVPDGCGGILQNCGATCTNGDTCGGGGTPDVCGQNAPPCVPLTAASCGNSCGQISDGCGGFVQCATCQLPETCGGGGTPGVCGAPACQPRTCQSLNAECGTVTDGCGTTLDCGSCTAPNTCGGGGLPNTCGAPVCVPKTQASACGNGMCGPQSDGCGGTVDCGGCTAPNTCGGGGTPSVCGAPPCTKVTCADVGANCGPISDGCGGVVESCGTCTAPAICGAVTPSVCGTAVNPNCTGLCPAIDWNCGSNPTTLTGKVYAPNGTDPLNNGLVYVPNAPLPAITTGASCVRCQDEDLGNPIAAALTGPDGAFVLTNVPAGVNFPLVVKMGKWRRVVTIPAVPSCTSVALTADQTRLPRSMSDATTGNVAYVNIPHFAIVTGNVDAIECVLRQIGVSDTEFTLPNGNGRIHMYRSNGGTMGCQHYQKNSTTACASTGTGDVIQAPLANLFAVTNGVTTLNSYDIGVFDCEGAENYHGTTDDAAIHAWANAGGRVFASHYSYTYLYKNGDYATTATWGGTQDGNGASTTGIVDTSFAKGQSFNTWLGNVNAWSPTYGSGYINITDPRDYVKSVATGTDRFIYTDSTVKINGTQINQNSGVEQYAFNTPYLADANNICGRILYSGFHVAGASALGNKVFPSYCSTGAMTAQEKVLEFMIFDLSACVSVGGPPPPATCTPKTCAQMGANCGQVADGCGGLLNCGTCTAPDSCGGGGVANQCGNYCTMTTCGAQGANCGIIADGCGGTLNCGTCTSPDICGGGGTPNICGAPPCTPRSCTDVGAQCGAISDGCGGTINCGTCAAPAICGGGGVPNVCGTGTCTPGNCGTASCGFVGDGCGGTVACGTCSGAQTCVAGVCTGSTCTPRTCGAVSATCGYIGDGCGGELNCGVCTPPQVCGGAGTPSQCGGSCTPRTCAQANAACGAISDGCGGVKECGACPSGQTCGGGGVPNQCGAGTCLPETCALAGAQCGSVGDGCGGVLSCGTCTAPKTCGGAGVANQCGNGGCIPLTCAAQKASCGAAADGCGGLLDCGSCPSGQTCGGGGVLGQCGSGTIVH